MDQVSAKTGEKIVVRRFARFQVGEAGRRGRAGRPAIARILLKLSGEALAGEQGYGIDPAVLGAARRGDPRRSHDLGRRRSPSSSAAATSSAASRRSADGMDRATADYMGMLATVINALALQDALEKAGVPTRVLVGHRDARRWPSPTSAGAPSATSRRAAS